MSRWYYWAAGFFLLDTMQAFGIFDRLVYGSWDGKGGDKITQSLNILLILASLSLFARGYRRNIGGFAIGSISTFTAIGYLFLTSLWSLEPAATLRVASVYAFVIMGAIGIARTFDVDEYFQLLSQACLVSAIASIGFFLVSPGSATMSGGYQNGTDFIGIFPHKNLLGQVMATGALATLHNIRVARRGYVSKLLILAVFLGMAFASKSTAALLVTLVFCSLSGFFILWEKQGAGRLIGICLATLQVPIFAAAILAPDVILEAIGKDPTLTGRTEIWAFVIKDIWMKPLLGWGYFGFWLLNNPAAVEISSAVQWVVPQAHNGLLEFLLTVGFVGTAIFVFLLVRILVLACQCLRTPQKALGISAMTCCIGIILEGVSETVLLEPTESLTTVLFISGLMCERAIWVARRQRQRRPLASRLMSVGRTA